MFADYSSFEDYIKTYGLEKSEAVLLRHLSEVYKILAQTVPPSHKTTELEEAEHFFRSMIRSTDSSLLDEWEKLKNPSKDSANNPPIEAKPIPYTRNKAALIRDVRSAILSFIKLLSLGRQEEAVNSIKTDVTSSELRAILEEFHHTHGLILLDPEARNKKHTHIQELPEKGIWKISQTLVDQEGLNDHLAYFELHLQATEQKKSPALHFFSIGQQ